MVDRRLSELDAYGHYPPTAGEVQRQLEVLVGSPSLRNSSQLCRFLRYVVDRTLAGDTGGLKENLLGTEVFQRGIRYDPRTDPVVRVEARRLRAKLEEYYGNGGAETSVVIRIPKGSYIPDSNAGRLSPAFHRLRSRRLSVPIVLSPSCRSSAWARMRKPTTSPTA